MGTKISKWDVNDIDFLRKQGYRPRNYYCGSWAHMAMWTRMRDYLRSYGIPFPFNPACYKHDAQYNTHPSIPAKFWIDFIFFLDMVKIIMTHRDLVQFRKRLLIRAAAYYIIVTIATPVYMAMGIVGKRGEKSKNGGRGN